MENAPSGLFQLEIGVQTTNPAVLSTIRRRGRPDLVIKHAKRLRHATNIHIHLDLIAGLPGESMPSIRRTFEALLDARPHMLQLGFLKVLPGTAMVEQARDFQFVVSPDPPHEVLATNDLSFEELSELHDVEQALDSWYNNPLFFHSITFLLERVANSQNTGAYKLFLRLARRLRDKTKGGKISLEGRYRLLWQYCTELPLSDQVRAAGWLLLDWFLAGHQHRPPWLPSWLNGRFPGQDNGEHLSFVFARQAIPGADELKRRGQTVARELGHAVRVQTEFFPFALPVHVSGEAAVGQTTEIRPGAGDLQPSPWFEQPMPEPTLAVFSFDGRRGRLIYQEPIQM